MIFIFSLRVFLSLKADMAHLIWRIVFTVTLKLNSLFTANLCFWFDHIDISQLFLFLNFTIRFLLYYCLWINLRLSLTRFLRLLNHFFLLRRRIWITLFTSRWRWWIWIWLAFTFHFLVFTILSLSFWSLPLFTLSSIIFLFFFKILFSFLILILLYNWIG